MSVGRQVFISQHIGDLETPEAMAAFERVIADFLRLYEAQPVAIAHDLHPEYLSTKWASRVAWTSGRMDEGRESAPFVLDPPVSRSRSSTTTRTSPLAWPRTRVDGPALGVTWDGTGYGADGTIWGGEFLLGDASGFKRVAHLRPFRLPGGDAAVKEPRRVALALLWELFGDAALEMDDLAPIRALRPTERKLLAQMLAKGINAPITTSAGRLFDGIAALIGLHQQVSFEGQAAMALEFAADGREIGAYPSRVSCRFKVEGSRSRPLRPSTFNLQPSTGALSSMPCWPTCVAASPRVSWQRDSTTRWWRRSWRWRRPRASSGWR